MIDSSNRRLSRRTISWLVLLSVEIGLVEAGYGARAAQDVASSPGAAAQAPRRGAVTVTIANLFSEAQATIVLRMRDSGTEHRVRGGGPFRIEDVPLGAYRVFAYGPSGRVSRAMQTFEVDRTRPEASVSLDMTENRAELQVRDADGQLARVLVTAWGGLPLPGRFTAIGPGRFSLAGIAPGSDIRIRPVAGGMPACRIAPLDAEVAVTLGRGRTVEVAFERRGVSGPVGTLSGVEGSDCPVPFAFFPMDRLPMGPAKVARGTIRNFPFSTDLMFEFQGLPQRVDVRAGVVVVY